MLLEEAKTIQTWLEGLPFKSGEVCLNIGSSTESFRKETQPFIHELIVAPLEKRGVVVVHCDMKAEQGVDMPGDLTDEDYRLRLTNFDPKLVLCSNLLEHVEEPQGLVSACAELVGEGGYLLITVPRSYPYHPDPLDTYFRPSPVELANLLPHWKVEASCEVVAGNLLDELRASGRGIKDLLRMTLRAMLPFNGRQKWRAAAHPLLWLFRPYRVSAVLLRRP